MEPLRPSDHHDSVVEPSAPAGIAQPKLGVVGWIRFAWRQLTSMRTALVLLLLLAVAAIPGSLVPQRSADPNGVVQFERDNPDLFPVLDALQVFDTYTSAWFSSIYLLLFVSLIGCIIPRTLHHARALRSRPPKTPARLNRLVGYTERAAEGSTVEAELATAEALLKKSRYRVERYGDSLSAERGYLRETGNLVFHMALVGVLATIGFAGGFGYNGQKILIEGQTFVNVRGDYDSLNPGRFFDETQLDPYSLRLDEFEAEYALDQTTGQVQPLDFTASVTTSEGGEQRERQIKVNEPLALGGTNAYLLGNGFAPVVTVRDAEGVEVFSEPIPFLPQDANLTSIGVVKVPTGLDEQLGMVGFFYPSALALESGALTSVYPEPDQPVLTLNAFVGDLGLDDGVPRNAYALATDDMEQISGGDTGVDSLVLSLGESLDLPNGLGSVEFTALPRFISVDIHHDPTQAGVLVSSILILGGLVVSLWVPRRRLWVVAEQRGDAVRLQYAGLARGDDPNIERAVDDLVRAHRGDAQTESVADEAVATR
ncbi:cytochrome c biogenesis protein ResB [Microcella daejeonensis]|uniref:cytochrome c biogenesis protein ResB n=1 Tax=Microcella daejeonensis TaxID=2994971 RepID=UPI0022722931|nr:cytochrome c biogenesis protein ResB [Microcella daejeonensis]WAB84253.1 cytochrome c biogenesis protein ResB [Microcella daejeonensis]